MQRAEELQAHDLVRPDREELLARIADQALSIAHGLLVKNERLRSYLQTTEDERGLARLCKAGLL